jgi:hypothetical protein
MFHKQLGVVAILSFCVGLLASLFFLGAALFQAYYFFIKIPIEVNLAGFGLSGLFRLLLVILFFLFISWWFGSIIMGLFPAIRVDETGLFVKNLIMIDHFTWSEVRIIKDAHKFKGTKVVVLTLIGNPILNFIRYYPYFMHGVMVGELLDPVILLSGGLAHRDEIRKEIGRQVRNKIAFQTSLPLKD